MYATEGALPVDAVPRGTRLLGLSPPTLDLRGAAYRLLARGLDDGEGAVVVTVDRGAERAATAVDELTADPDALERLAVVDATGRSDGPRTGGFAVETVSSPADLTGIGVSVTRALETLVGQGLDDVRLVVDSLSSMVVYADFEPVYRFTHTLAVRVAEIGGLGLFLLSGDTDGDQAGSLGSIVDGTVEVREGEGGPEWRVRGLDAADRWVPFDSVEVGTGVAEPPADSGSGPESVGRDDGDDLPPEMASPASLHELIEAVEAARYTLTVCNPGAGNGQREELRDYFDGLGVDVRTADLSTPEPRGVAVLHRGEEPLAMSPADELVDAVRFDDPEGTTPTTVRPDVLDRAHRQQYTVENGGKLRMVRISRLVETRALDVGQGTLHAGFQRLDRVEDELGTRGLYERIAATDVDVHIYGQPGPVPNPDLYTIHEGETGELADSWFVVYDGAGRGDAMGALVSEETAHDRYSGFWTYRPPIVRAASEYLQSKYDVETPA